MDGVQLLAQPICFESIPHEEVEGDVHKSSIARVDGIDGQPELGNSHHQEHEVKE